MADLTTIAKTVAKFAPLIGAVIPIPGAVAIGTAVATLFGAKTIDDPSLPGAITQDPQAQIKLQELSNQYRIEAQKILADQAIAQLNYESKLVDDELDDRKSARAAGVSHIGYDIDNTIKLILACASVVLILACLAAILLGDITQSEVALLSGILGLISGAFTAMIGYYFGTSFSSKQKTEMMNRK